MDFSNGIPNLPVPANESSDSSSSDSSSDSGTDEGDDECMMLLTALHLYVTLRNSF